MLRGALAAGGAVLILLAVAVGALALRSSGAVSDAGAPARRAGTPSGISKPASARPPADNFEWPFYGYDAARTRFVDEPQLAPPFRLAWRFDNGGALLEFPPTIYQHTLYFLDDNGWVKAVDLRTGHLLWHHKLGGLAAASPALDVRDGLLFVPLMSVESGASEPGNGLFAALSMDSGRLVWSRPVPSGSESSPLVDGSSVIFGDQGGTVYSLRLSDGHVNWTFEAGGPVKGGVALVGGRIYFADYGGHVYSVDAANGHEFWMASPGGEFYSTPAVAFGRVYLGNTNGDVYAFSQSSGALDWSTSTGAYVYAAPAVADVAGLGPTVYLGSYDANFYALDASSGAVRWTHAAAGRISGSATIVGSVVYYADLGSSSTTGLDVRTGRQVFSFPDGKFTPVICDEHALYLIGYSTIYQFVPR